MADEEPTVESLKLRLRRLEMRLDRLADRWERQAVVMDRMQSPGGRIHKRSAEQLREILADG